MCFAQLFARRKLLLMRNLLLSALLLPLLLAANDQPTPLFNGKDLSGWKPRDPKAPTTWKVTSEVHLDPKDPKKLLGTGEGGAADSVLLRMDLGKGEAGSDLITEKLYGDCKIHLEFFLAKDSNSGLFLQGQYEIQITDSFGIPDNKLTEGECGGIPWTKKPATNACKKPGEWQTLDVEFLAPRFEAGKKVKNAHINKIILNGKTTVENFDIPAPTGNEIEGGERALGPILLQAVEGVAAFRNIQIIPLAD
jgi:hypothetical protein